ncbi:nuclease-related domain-containing protein [Endozoicomonas sp. SESOKO1]|uniref:nuclease-related domain-containing protein n=1 Tax=Endozoicomonas sp. SESOKO1 TaxID=2828742 RepID=UPI00214978E9
MFLVLAVVVDGSAGFALLFIYIAVFIFVLFVAAIFKMLKYLYRRTRDDTPWENQPKWDAPENSKQQQYDARDYYRKFGYYRQNGPNQKKKVYTETYRDKNQPSSSQKQAPQEDGYYYSERLKRPVYRETFKSRTESPAPTKPVDAEFQEIKATAFRDHKAAGDFGEAKVRAVLSELKGKVIYGFIGSQNIFYAGKNFEIDFVLSVPGVGFIMAEVKYHSGKITCDNKPIWTQYKTNGTTYEYKNASQQVIRTRGLFKKLLTDHEMNKWPIKSVVIYAHENAVIYPAMSPDNPQTDVIKLENLESWIKKLPKNDQIRMTREEHQQIEKLISKHHREYEEA